MSTLYDIKATEQYDKIIEEILRQCNHMIVCSNIEPNKVIVGTWVFNVLKYESGAVYRHQAEGDDVAEVLGLTIKIDWNNPYTIEVCYGDNKADIRDFFGVKH